MNLGFEIGFDRTPNKGAGGVTPSTWLLASGSWNDNGVWDDAALWKDA